MQRHWTLWSESGLPIPIDVWDPTAYARNDARGEKQNTRPDKDTELIAMLYARTKTNEINHKLDKSKYSKMNKVSWTLNPEMFSGYSKMKRREKVDVNERNTKFNKKGLFKKM
eukprot:UN27853